MKAIARTRFNDVHREAISSFIEAGGPGNEDGIILTDMQEKLLQRWRMADEKIRQGKYTREEIASTIIGQFDVCRDTAFKDIVNAEHVFSSSAPLNKKYITGRRIEFLQTCIWQAWQDKNYEAIARLEKELRQYIAMYPETAAVRSPKIINFIFQENVLNVNMTGQQARDAADAIIAKQIEERDDY